MSSTRNLEKNKTWIQNISWLIGDISPLAEICKCLKIYTNEHSVHVENVCKEYFQIWLKSGFGSKQVIHIQKSKSFTSGCLCGHVTFCWCKARFTCVCLPVSSGTVPSSLLFAAFFLVQTSQHGARKKKTGAAKRGRRSPERYAGQGTEKETVWLKIHSYSVSFFPKIWSSAV